MLEHYTQDRDAGHEEPWEGVPFTELSFRQFSNAISDLYRQSQWGAERALYSRQLQDANKRIHELEAELRKLREDMRKLMHAAANPPQIQEEPVAFPARALRFSI